MRPSQRPSADAETEARERELGLTADVARVWAAQTPAILGPLRDLRTFRPLSLEGGRLRAVSLARVPDVPDWQAWLVDVEHVQTDDPDVCAALADVALFLTPEATSEVSHPGWFPRLALLLAALDVDLAEHSEQDPHEAPQRWAIYHGGAMRPPAIRPTATMWIDGL